MKKGTCLHYPGGLLCTDGLWRGTTGVLTDMEPGLSLARLQAMHGMAWDASTLSHSHSHLHTLTPFSSPPFSPTSPPLPRRFPTLLLLALSCPALSCTSLSLGFQPLPLELVGDFPPTISCPRAARHLRELSPASLGSAPCRGSLHSILIADRIYLRNILGLGGRSHQIATLIH